MCGCASLRSCNKGLVDDWGNRQDNALGWPRQNASGFGERIRSIDEVVDGHLVAHDGKEVRGNPLIIRPHSEDGARRSVAQQVPGGIYHHDAIEAPCNGSIGERWDRKRRRTHGAVRGEAKAQWRRGAIGRDGVAFRERDEVA